MNLSAISDQPSYTIPVWVKGIIASGAGNRKTANTEDFTAGFIQDFSDVGSADNIVEVQSIKHGGVVSTKQVAVRDVYLSDTYFGHRDNGSLTYLNAPNLLENIARRYKDADRDEKEIYTFTGSLLIAMNPYRPLPSLYSEAVQSHYVGKSITAVEPHPFAIAEAAYNSLLKSWKSQSIIISGESGSGKTECSKHVLKYLAFISDKRHDSRNLGIESRVLQTNPILEAFGNAKTVHNENSSRFGKLMKLHFDRSGRMLGASIQTYLLAKSRVCHTPASERNYHIFYWMCRGARINEREKWQLRSAEYYRYLDTNDRLNSVTQFQDIRNSMELVGLASSTGQQDDVFRVLTAILTLGNLQFSNGTRSDGAKNVTVLARRCNSWEIKENNENKVVEVTNNNNNSRLSNTGETEKSDNIPFTDDDVSVVCNLLGLNTEEARDNFELVITSKKIRDVRSNLSLLQAKQTVDALARALYQLVFDYLVRRINTALSRKQQTSSAKAASQAGARERGSVSGCRMSKKDGKPLFSSENVEPAAGIGCGSVERANQASSPGLKERSRYVGVLDIFGFENLYPSSPNSFEQLCINYANERLHNFFLDQLIFRELDLYKSEGISVPVTTDEAVLSSTGICATIAGSRIQPGIFNLLDEASLVAVVGERDAYFCKKVNAKFATSLNGSQHRNVDVAKSFTVSHFAGDVEYTAQGFTGRNVDIISNDLKGFLLSSCSPFISNELCNSLRAAEESSGLMRKFMGARLSTRDGSCQQKVNCCQVCGARVDKRPPLGPQSKLRPSGSHEMQRAVNPSHLGSQSAVASAVLCKKCTILPPSSSTSIGPTVERSASIPTSSQQSQFDDSDDQSNNESSGGEASAVPSQSEQDFSLSLSSSQQRLGRGLGTAGAGEKHHSDSRRRTSSVSYPCPNEVTVVGRNVNVIVPGRMSTCQPGNVGGGGNFRFRSLSLERDGETNTTTLERRRGKEGTRRMAQKAKSLASLFSLQVYGLMDTLQRTSSFFIRCIKPNDEQRPFHLVRSRVLQQLKTGGMVAVLELMKGGFPCRIPFDDLWQRYGSVIPSTMALTPRDFTEIILLFIKTPPSEYRIGLSRAFFRFGALNALEIINSITDEDTKRNVVDQAFKFWLEKKRKRALSAIRCCVQLWLSTVRRRCRIVAHEALAHYNSHQRHRAMEIAAIVVQRMWRGGRKVRYDLARKYQQAQITEEATARISICRESIARTERISVPGHQTTDPTYDLQSPEMPSSKRRRLRRDFFVPFPSPPQHSVGMLSQLSVGNEGGVITPRFPAAGPQSQIAVDAGVASIAGDVIRDVDRFSVMGSNTQVPVPGIINDDHRCLTRTMAPPGRSSQNLIKELSPSGADLPFYTPREPPPSPQGMFGQFIDGKWVALDLETIHERLEHARSMDMMQSSDDHSYNNRPQHITIPADSERQISLDDSHRERCHTCMDAPLGQQESDSNSEDFSKTTATTSFDFNDHYHHPGHANDVDNFRCPRHDERTYRRELKNQYRRLKPMYKPWLLKDGVCGNSAPDTPRLYSRPQMVNESSGPESASLFQQSRRFKRGRSSLSSSVCQSPTTTKLFQLPQFKAAVLDVVLSELDDSSRSHVVANLRSKRIPCGITNQLSPPTAAPGSVLQDMVNEQNYEGCSSLNTQLPTSDSWVISSEDSAPQTTQRDLNRMFGNSTDEIVNSRLSGQVSGSSRNRRPSIDIRTYRNSDRRVSWRNIGPWEGVDDDGTVESDHQGGTPDSTRRDMDDGEDHSSPLLREQRQQIVLARNSGNVCGEVLPAEFYGCSPDLDPHLPVPLPTMSPYSSCAAHRQGLRKPSSARRTSYRSDNLSADSRLTRSDAHGHTTHLGSMSRACRQPNLPPSSRILREQRNRIYNQGRSSASRPSELPVRLSYQYSAESAPYVFHRNCEANMPVRPPCPGRSRIPRVSAACRGIIDLRRSDSSGRFSSASQSSRNMVHANYYPANVHVSKYRSRDGSGSWNKH